MLTKTELLNRIREIVGESTDDKVLSLYEDISDTFSDENVDWKSKYEELDNNWRQRYRERFFTTGEEVKEEQTEDVKDDGEVKTFEELFEEREG